MNHIGGDLALTIGLASWLEGYAATSAYANSDTANQPSLLQVLGDTDFGLKAFGSVGKIFHVGGATELWLDQRHRRGRPRRQRDEREVSRDRHGGPPRAPRSTPRCASASTCTYSLDNSGDVVSAYEASQKRGRPVTRIERYGLNFNRVDHFDIGIGVEGFFVDERIRPFLEYNIMIPVNRQGYQCNRRRTRAATTVSRSTRSRRASSRSAAVSSRGSTASASLAAFDIGITGQNDFIEEMAPIPPWTFYSAPAGRSTRRTARRSSKTKVVEKETAAAPVFGHIKGYVNESRAPGDGRPERHRRVREPPGDHVARVRARTAASRRWGSRPASTTSP